MAKIGMKQKSEKEQRLDAELGLIIDEMGLAMWNADRHYISADTECQHDVRPRFTLNMEKIWSKYVDFCRRNPNA